MDHQLFEIAEFRTQEDIICSLKLAYITRGKLNARRDNGILILTSYAAQHDEAESLVSGLDLSEYYLIVVNMFSNGLSSSPSNTPAPLDGPRFPNLTIHDNVQCQRRLLAHLDVTHLKLVMGYSMGALQAYEWASQFPDMVSALLPICGAARVSGHNYLFLEGAKAALCADQHFAKGDYNEQPTIALRAFSTVYAGWMFSAAFFRDAVYQQMGMSSIEEVTDFASNYFMRRDANDLLSMLWTWQHADISRNPTYQEDFAAALGAITASVELLPGSTDQYFTVADNELEQQSLKHATLNPIESPLGHVAGSGFDPTGKAAIDRAVVTLLGSQQ